MTDDAGRFRQSPSTPWRRVGDDVILAPPGRDDFDVLSGTGARVWEVLDVPSSITEVIAALAELYGVAEDDIAADVKALVDRLVSGGAIEQIEERHASVR